MTSDESCRPYRQQKRKAAADATRVRILEAARQLLANDTSGADSFTLDSVARQAGVTRMTLYHHFGSKTGLLEGLSEYLGERGGMSELPQVFRLTDPYDALYAYFQGFGQFWATDRAVMRRLRALAVLDPDAAKAMSDRDGQRQWGARYLSERLLEQHPTGSGLERETAIRSLYALTSFEAFDALAGPDGDPRNAATPLFALALAALGVSAK